MVDNDRFCSYNNCVDRLLYDSVGVVADSASNR